jgi:hypothetical protein|tara:strand:+ start:22 stop:213 length:192 start_codon:yes stop_codon:yes gene_type:complete
MERKLLMATNRESLLTHEKECALRYEHIQARLESGNARFDKIERLIFGVYPFILAAVAIGKWL